MKTKVVKIYKQGEVEELKIEETYLRKTGEDDLVIEHQFCGLNYIDINQRNGLYPLKKLPIEVGMEAAGIVVEIGKNVTNFKPGDKVCHCMNIGSFSKKFVINQKRVIKLDDKTDLKLAASATLQGLTAQYLLHHSWPLKKDHTLLIHAVSGGVGQLLCQWAKLIGANVIGTVGTKEKENVAKSLGCDFVINYDESDFEKLSLYFTNGKGVDVIYDSVGKSTFHKGINILKKKGRIVSFGFSSGKIEPLDINKLRPISGSIATGGLLTYISDPIEMQNNANQLFNLINQEKLKISIYNEYKIEEIQKAHHQLENRKTTGKIIFNI